jgi:hypothetical protein
MSDIAWVDASNKELTLVTKKRWHTESVNIARETKIQLQSLMSEDLEEEYESLED